MREMNKQPVVFLDGVEAESKTVTEGSALDVVVALLLLEAQKKENRKDDRCFFFQ